MNRRDFLRQAALVGGLATIQPWHLMKLLGAPDMESALQRLGDWDLSASALPTQATTQTATKIIWNARLNTGMPSTLWTTYGILRAPQLLRSTDTDYASTWPVDTDEPSSAWHDNFAEYCTTNASFFPINFVHLDIESWPVSTQAERLATATKYANFASEFRSRMPGWKIGFYAYPQITGSNYAGLNDENDDMAEAWAAIDGHFPSLYFNFTRASEGAAYSGAGVGVHNVARWTQYHIREARRCIRAYNTRGARVYPYVWERKGANPSLGVPLDFDVYEKICRLSYQLADGVVIWGGFHALDGTETQQTWSSDTNGGSPYTGQGAQGAWWNNLWWPMISSGRFWGKNTSVGT